MIKILVKIKIPTWERYLQPLMQSPVFLLRIVFIVFTSSPHFSISGMRVSRSFQVSSIETEGCERRRGREGRGGEVGVWDSFSNMPAAGVQSRLALFNVNNIKCQLNSPALEAFSSLRNWLKEILQYQPSDCTEDTVIWKTMNTEDSVARILKSQTLEKCGLVPVYMLESETWQKHLPT